MRYESLLGVQQSKIAIKVTVSHKKRRGGLALTWANPVNKVKSRNLHVRLRNLFHVRTMGNACDWWENFNNTAFSIFSRKTNKTADWFDSHTEEMILASEEKRRARAAYKACPTKQNPHALPAARSKQRTKNLIWTKFTLYKFGAKKCTPRLNQGQSCPRIYNPM